MTQRRKLIFFTTADPRTSTDPLFRAYHFASVASASGLEAEVRLAGEAVSVVDLDAVPDTDLGRDVRQKIAAGSDAPFLVSF